MESDNDDSNATGNGKETPSNSQILRPRRNVMQKNVEYGNGLHWIEEKDLKKALYASLQESKKLKPNEIDVDASDSLMTGMGQGRKRKHDAAVNGDESGDSAKRAKVHAQRKFAQGSNPASPTVTPIKVKSQTPAAVEFIPMKRPKTEDFLTFLCLRGTPILPSSFNFFNAAATNESNGDNRCQSPFSADIAEKPKSQSRISGKVSKAASLMAQVKTRNGNKKLPETTAFSSSESSISDSENDSFKMAHTTGNHLNKRQGKLVAGSTNNGTLKCRREMTNSRVFNNLRESSSVLALKQKYRQQRIAKEKEALVRAKKPEVSVKKDLSNVCKVKSDVRLVIDKWPNTDLSTVKLSSLSTITDKTSKSKPLVNSSADNGTAVVTEKKTASSLKTAASQVNGDQTLKKPVTRNAAILLQAARDKAQQEEKELEKEKATKLASKAAAEDAKKKQSESKNDSNQICDYEKHLPLLESEHSYVKRLPASEVNIPKQKCGSLKNSSDFSSSDDEPLVKKKEGVTRGLQKQFTVASKRGKASSTYITRSVRSCDQAVSVETATKSSVSSRPTRKTKEAASVYLELLGQRLNSCDDDYEVPPKPNSLINRDYKKQLFVTPEKQKLHSLRGGKYKEAQISDTKMKSAQNLDSSTSSSTSSSSSTTTNSSSSSTSSTSTSTTSTSPSTSNSSPEMTNKVALKTIRPTKKWPLGKSPTVVQCLNTPLERIDVVKTRDFMRKLSDARFNLARDQAGKICSKKVPHTRQMNIVQNIEEPKYLVKNNLAKVQDRKKYPNMPECSGKSVVKVTKQRPVESSMTRSNLMKSQNKKLKAKPLKKGPEVLTKNSVAGTSMQRLNKNRNKHQDEDESSSSDSSSYTPAPPPKVVPYKRGPGRVPAMHALRHIPIPDISDSTSTESSDEEDIPSKPEVTTISVRQNVTSNSVAVQVNLLNDISDFDDDCIWEPGFMESGIEGLFSLERTGTPLFQKTSPQTRNSWETENPSSSSKALLCKSGDPTPPKKIDVMGSQVNLCGNRMSNTPKKLLRCSTSSSSSPSPVVHKDVKRPVIERIDLESSSDDDSSGFHIPIGSFSGVKEAPVFHPTEKEFQDPLLYIEKIRAQAEKFGICKIIPPSPFKPECKISNEMRFTGHNQYVHKVFHRFGPNVQELSVIKKHLEAQKIEYDNPPLIGGMEVDLPRLFHTVQQYGGLKEVIEKKKWQKVADSMKIPKTALDKVSKLYEAYCKYLLPYDTLSRQEKQDIENKVCSERKKSRFAENDECVTKGRSMSLSSFYRIARNTMAMWCKNDAKPSEVEQEYWRIVNQRRHHVCVHAGNIDSSTFGYGFSSNKNSVFGKHPWNLKVLTNNQRNILRCMGPIMGVTIPTLHVSMLFTTGCWYRDPHCLPWIEYLHTGASKIWYSVPASQSCKFRDAMRKIVPEFCTNNPIWLPSDTAMVPPDLLIENGVTLNRLVQNSGQFVVVFPRVFTSTICGGYSVSESVSFAGSDWLEIAPIAFKEITDSCEPAVFSLQRVLLGIAKDNRISADVLNQVLPLLKDLRDQEYDMRKRLYSIGLKQSQHVESFEVKDSKNRQSRNTENQVEECEICQAICFVSLVHNKQDGVVYCLRHALEHLQKKKKDIKFSKLLYTYEIEELDGLIREKSSQLQVKDGNKRAVLKKSATKKAS
ncbi:jumonji, AT rich interactive domain 2 [Chamberlinius hualienensis]